MAGVLDHGRVCDPYRLGVPGKRPDQLADASLRGAYAVLRNPSGHREIGYHDVAEAARRLGHLGEVPRRLYPLTVGAADRGEMLAAALIERWSENS
jgi:hypothetical protein